MVARGVDGQREDVPEMDGLLMWGLFLPVLLVIAGIVTLRRRKIRRR
jgi:hypothetical protein